MAIDESLLGGVRPNESAVDRLRKRNRIRPWESALVGTQPKQSNEAVDTSSSPPGQNAQGVSQPLGDSTGGAFASREDRPLGGSQTNSSNGTAPLGEKPSVLPAQGAMHPLGKSDFHAGLEQEQASLAQPTGSRTQGAHSPGGEKPTGVLPIGKEPSGSNAQTAAGPVGVSVESNSTNPSLLEHREQEAKHPRGEIPTGQVAAKPDSVPLNGFDPTPFVPAEKEGISWREKGSGELRIPHRIYEYAHRVTTTRNELLVFDCLLRFSLGFHRSWCEAGYSFIAAWTGISDITNIKKSLKTLLGSGIVVKTKDHDSATNSGTVYEVPVVKGYLEFVAQKKASLGTPQSSGNPLGNLPSGQVNQSGAAPAAGGRNTSRPVGDLPPKKENSNQNSKKTLSQSGAEDLDTYVDQIKPASKRESEVHFLGTLLSEYSSQDVSDALLYVQKFGVLGSKEKCHSPLKYLSTAIEQVLPKAREYQSLLRRQVGEMTEPKTGHVPDENESAEELLRNMAVAAFETELSQKERDRLLAETTTQNSVKGYSPPLNVLRTMAALEWFQRTRGNA